MGQSMHRFDTTWNATTTIRRLTAVTLALLMGCMPSVGTRELTLDERDCPVAEDATCTCPGGLDTARLTCAPDGSIYCQCEPSQGASEPLPQDMGVPDAGIGEDMDLIDLDDMLDSEMPSEPCSGSACNVECADILGTSFFMDANWVDTAIAPDSAAPNQATYGYDNRSQTLCMRGQGQDAYAETDDFYFIHQTISQDFDFKFEILDFDGTEPYSKLGLMFRQDTGESSPFVMLQITDGRGLGLIGRHAEGARGTVAFTNFEELQPRWVRLKRQGRHFYAYTSLDGTMWRALGVMMSDEIATSGQLGVALMNNNPALYATAKLRHIEIETAPMSLPDDCSTVINCQEMNALLHLDVLRDANLSRTLFETPDTLTIPVTEQGTQTLQNALMQARTRAEAGQYTIIELDPTQITAPIAYPYGINRIENVWIKGNGATISYAGNAGESALRLDHHVILEGIVFEDVEVAISMDTEGGPSSKKRTGIWIHHNHFKSCASTCIELGPSLGDETRHITIDHNIFGEDSMLSSVAGAIDASNNCADADTACKEREENLWLSVHHNLYEPSVQSSYLSGGAQSLFYNNWIKHARSHIVQLGTSGRTLARHNLYEAPMETSYNVYSSGAAGIDHGVSDIHRNVRYRTNYGSVPPNHFPTYFTFLALGEETLEGYLTEMAGPTPATSR